MRGAVFISTYRRPEMVKNCVESILPVCREKGYNVCTISPFDEQYSFGDGHYNFSLEEHLSGTGAGAPRWYACELAKDFDLEYFALLDDDTWWPKGGIGIHTMFETLRDYPEFGTMRGSSRYPPRVRHPENPALALDWFVGIGFAVRTEAMIKAGNVDMHLARNEDVDFKYRTQIVGYEPGGNMSVACHHYTYSPGGLSAKEGTSGKSREEVKEGALPYRLETTRKVVEKYPVGTVRMDRRGFLAFPKKKLHALQDDYKNGLLIVNEDGVRYR